MLPDYSIVEKLGFSVESPEYQDITKKARAVFAKKYQDELGEAYLVELVVNREGRILFQRYFRLYEESDGTIISTKLSRLPRLVKSRLEEDLPRLTSAS